MKIAIITSGFLPVVDGVTVSGYHRLCKLSQWGHQVLLFCPDYSPLKDKYPNWKEYSGEILPGVRVVNLQSTPFMELDFERNVSRRSYQTVIRELHEFRPDIIHVDEPERLFVGFFRIPGIDYAKQAGIPCVSFFRTNFLDYAEDYFDLPGVGIVLIQAAFRQLLKFVYNAYDATLVTSQMTYNKIVKLGIKNALYASLAGFDAANFDPDLRQNNFFESHYGCPSVDQKIKLIFLGRLTPDKGWNFTLKAFSQVLQAVNPDHIAILIAGDGPLADQIAQSLKALTPHVHLLGRVAPQKVPALLANSDIHVTASEKETLGLTVLEAFAAGIPVLAPRSGGVVENIKDGWNGFLFTPQNQEDFTFKLKQLVENASLRQVMGARGREQVEQYSWEQAVQNLVDIWQQQIEDGSPAHAGILTAVEP